MDTAKEIMDKAASSGTTLHLPTDFVWGRDIETAQGVCTGDSVPDDGMLLDIGPDSIKKFCEVIERSKTIVWNGPMGLFEKEPFAQGSLKVCEAMAGLDDATTIVGGGDTDAVVHQAKLEDKFTFISTGGGSFLEFLEGKELPAFKALKENS